MRAALRRSRRGRSTQNYIHIHTPTHAGREGENNPERARGWSQGRGKGDSGRMKKFGKRINIDRFWKVGQEERRTVIRSRSQDARWRKKIEIKKGLESKKI